MSEVKQWLHSKARGFDLTIADEDVMRLIELVDLNTDGRINYEEFLKITNI